MPACISGVAGGTGAPTIRAAAMVTCALGLAFSVCHDARAPTALTTGVVTAMPTESCCKHGGSRPPGLEFPTSKLPLSMVPSGKIPPERSEGSRAYSKGLGLTGWSRLSYVQFAYRFCDVRQTSVGVPVQPHRLLSSAGALVAAQCRYATDLLRCSIPGHNEILMHAHCAVTASSHMTPC